MGSDSNTWCKSVGNEPGRLANVINNQVRTTNNIEFIRKGEAPRGHTVTYVNFVCDYRPMKLEPFRFILTVRGDRL